MLERDVPAALSDGDIVTFGKTVGRNEEVVRPVVARVQLIYGSAPIKPLVVPDSPSLANKSHTGRYGLRSPSSSSSDEAYNGQSDAYSDVEAETPPPPPATSAPEPKPESHFGRAIEVLKRFLPPSAPPAPSSSHASVRSGSPRLDEQSPYNSHSPSPVPGALPSPPSLPHLVTEVESITSPQECFNLPPLHLNPPDVLRSESPMELASSSSPPVHETHIISACDWTYCFPAISLVENVGDPLLLESSPDRHLGEEHESATDAADDIPAPPWCSSPNKGKEADKEPQAIDISLFVTKSEYEDLKAKYIMLQVSAVSSHLQYQC